MSAVSFYCRCLYTKNYSSKRWWTARGPAVCAPVTQGDDLVNVLQRCILKHRNKWLWIVEIAVHVRGTGAPIAALWLQSPCIWEARYTKGILNMFTWIYNYEYWEDQKLSGWGRGATNCPVQLTFLDNFHYCIIY